MFKVWKLVVSCLLVCNAQASNKVANLDHGIVSDFVLECVVFRNRLVCLHNDIVQSLHSDDFKEITPDQRVEYLHDLRRKTVNRYGSSAIGSQLRDRSYLRQDRRNGVWQCNPHQSHDIDKRAMSNLLWVDTDITNRIAKYDEIIKAGCLPEQVSEITSKVSHKRIERKYVANYLGDDDDSDTESFFR